MDTGEARGVGPRLRNFASRARFVSRRLGWTHVPLWLGSTLGRRLSFHILVVMLHSIDEVGPRVSEQTAGLEARFLTGDEITRFASDEDYRYSATFAADALARGHRCFGLFERGHLVSYCWYAGGSAPALGDVEVAVDFPFVYGFNAYTEAEQRGRGLHIYGVSAASQALKPEGFQGVTAYIEADNLSPLVAAQKMREQLLGYVFLFRMFGRFRWLSTPGCRKGGFKVCRRDQGQKNSRETQPPA